MSDILRRYMTVTMSVMPDGLELSCWMSVEEFWNAEKAQFPFNYVHMGDGCTWIIHSNRELTVKVIGMVGEAADSICRQQQERNNRRKLANR